MNAKRPPARQLQNPLKLFLHWDVVLILLFAGIGYSVMYGVLAPLSVLIKEVYPSLTDTGEWSRLQHRTSADHCAPLQS